MTYYHTTAELASRMLVDEEIIVAACESGALKAHRPVWGPIIGADHVWRIPLAVSRRLENTRHNLVHEAPKWFRQPMDQAIFNKLAERALRSEERTNE